MSLVTSAATFCKHVLGSVNELSGMKIAVHNRANRLSMIPAHGHQSPLAMRNIKWTVQKPQTQGRFWWADQPGQAPTLVYIEQQSLGLYVLGAGWVPYQPGQWAGPFGEPDAPCNN